MSEERTDANSFTPEQRSFIDSLPVAPSPMEIYNLASLAKHYGYMIDALTAERDAARAELARLRERLTKLADENEEIGRNHDFFVGSPAHAACAITWGIAGLELRKALGEDGVK